MPPGKEVTIDLAVEPGTVTVNVQPTPKSGKLGVASAILIGGGFIAAKTANDLQLAMAAAPPGSQQWVIIRAGEAANTAGRCPLAGPGRPSSARVSRGSRRVCGSARGTEVHGQHCKLQRGAALQEHHPIVGRDV